MKCLRPFIPSALATLTLASLVGVTGCSSDGTDTGALTPADVGKHAQERSAKFVLMDAAAQYSVTCEGLQEGKTVDGRLEVAALVRNKESRRIEVQIQCVFKDANGFAVDETPWTTLILTENGMETAHYTALSPRAVAYTVRVRQAR